MPAPLPPDFDDRRLEVRVGLAELLGDDVGVRQNRGRAGDVDLVARRRLAGKRERANDGRRRRIGDELCAHTNLPVLEVDARARAVLLDLGNTASLAPARRRLASAGHSIDHCNYTLVTG